MLLWQFSPSKDAWWWQGKKILELIFRSIQKTCAETGNFPCPQCHQLSSLSSSSGSTHFLFLSPPWLDSVNLVSTLLEWGDHLKVAKGTFKSFLLVVLLSGRLVFILMDMSSIFTLSVLLALWLWYLPRTLKSSSNVCIRHPNNCHVSLHRTLRLKSRPTSKLSRSRSRRDRRLTVLVAAMVYILTGYFSECSQCLLYKSFQLFSYMMCWLPYAVTSIAETAGFTPTSQV